MIECWSIRLAIYDGNIDGQEGKMDGILGVGFEFDEGQLINLNNSNLFWI